MATDRVRGYAREEAARFGTTAAEVLSHSRKWANVSARKCVVRRLYADGFPMAQIGRWLGHCDHSTVSHFLNSPEPRP